MNADLVGPSRFYPDLQQGNIPFLLQHPDMAKGRLPSGTNRVDRSQLRMSNGSYGRVYGKILVIR
jgi:hypothetical protein